MEKLIIVGLGGAGYTAGIYASRYGLDPLLIGEADGGMIVENPIVENFPGYPQPTSGYVIMENMKKQAESFGARILNDKVKLINPLDVNDFNKGYIVETTFNGIFETKSLILATGTEKVHLNVPGEKEFFGKGVSYCATCDGFFYRGKVVVVVGGGDTALIEALYLSDICSKVYLIHRRDTFRGEPIRQQKLKQKTNVEFILSATIKEIRGDKKVTNILVCQSDGQVYDDKNCFEIQIDVDGVFIAVGTKPNPINGLDNYLKRDEKGYIIVDNHQKTNLPGVFAAGDCSTGSAGFRQLVTACGEGAVAAESAFKYLNN